MKATKQDRERASEIVKAFTKKYNSHETARILGINRQSVSFIKNMHVGYNDAGSLYYMASHASVQTVLRWWDRYKGVICS